jgi:hypothetical protein
MSQMNFGHAKVKQGLLGTLFEAIKFSGIWMILWKFTKWVVRCFILKNHEIYRICNGARSLSIYDLIWNPIKQGAPNRNLLRLDHFIVTSLDRSIFYSSKLTIARRQLEAAESANILPVVSAIARKKFPLSENLDSKAASDYQNLLNPSVNILSENIEPKDILYNGAYVIHFVNQFIYLVNQKAATKYDSTVRNHENKLYAIHQNLLGKRPTQRITKEWELLGFQGNDPSTDFRSMGKLALEQLEHFSQSKDGKQTWGESGGSYGYSWAIAGIQLTAYQLQLLRSRKLHHILFRIYFFISQNEVDAPEASSEFDDVVMKKMTNMYYDMFGWLFKKYHDCWVQFCTDKDLHCRNEKSNFIPMLCHNEFFQGFCLSMEGLLFENQFFHSFE